MTYSAVDSEPILECVVRMRELAIERCWSAWDRRDHKDHDYWLGHAGALGIIEHKIRTRAVRWEEER